MARLIRDSKGIMIRRTCANRFALLQLFTCSIMLAIRYDLLAPAALLLRRYCYYPACCYYCCFSPSIALSLHVYLVLQLLHISSTIPTAFAVLPMIMKTSTLVSRIRHVWYRFAVIMKAVSVVLLPFCCLPLYDCMLPLLQFLAAFQLVLTLLLSSVISITIVLVFTAHTIAVATAADSAAASSPWSCAVLR